MNNAPEEDLCLHWCTVVRQFIHYESVRDDAVSESIAIPDDELMFDLIVGMSFQCYARPVAFVSTYHIPTHPPPR